MIERTLDDREAWSGLEEPPGGEVPAARDSLRSRARAREAARPGSPVSFPGSLDRARLWLTQTLVPAITAVAEKQGTLADSQPPTFRQARARHKECAGHYTSSPAQAQRMAYGYLHMALIKAPLNYIEWATDSELRAVIHVALGLAAWLGLLLGGYL
jgi:hypothetical protein